MPLNYMSLTFTDSVKQAQEHYGTRSRAARMEVGDDDVLTQREVEFIAARDSFYVASVGEGGWPYLQFRGGPVGFVKVLDRDTLGYADFRGNLQYITTGNLQQNDRVALFFMDYAGRKRLKVMAHAQVFDAAKRPDLADQLEDPNYRARVERFVTYKIAGFDWNCPQHITSKLTAKEMAPVIGEYEKRISELEAELRTAKPA